MSLTDINNQVIAHAQLQINVPVDQQAHAFYFVDHGVVAVYFVIPAIDLLPPLHNQRHPNSIMHQSSLLRCYQMYFADETIDAAAPVLINMKKRHKKSKVDYLRLPRKVLAVVPFDNLILNIDRNSGNMLLISTIISCPPSPS